MPQVLLWLVLACFTTTLALLRIPLALQEQSKTNYRKDFNTFITSNSSIYPKKLHLLLNNRKNLEYYGTIGLGSPPQQFRVLFDTGSANTWLPSTNCPKSNVACHRHSRYNANKSATYISDGRNFSLGYGSGRVTGYLSYDILHVAGIQVTNLIFGQALLQHQSVFSSATFDGIVGLGMSKIAWTGTIPFIQRLCQLHLVEHCVFSVYLHRNAKDKVMGKGGEIVFGGIDESQFSGKLHYVPVTPSGYWEIKISKVIVGENNKIDGPVNAILDTGTSLILVPEYSYDGLHLALGAKLYGGHYVLHCQLKQLPNIRLIIEGQDFVITPTDYIIEVIDHNSSNETGCVTVFVPIVMNFWVLGDIFLGRYYTVYDLDKERIGLAMAKPNVN